MSDPKRKLIAMKGVIKEFPGVRALDGVDFTLEAGEVHVLFGENGAGKSTLISILSGVYHPTEGTITKYGEQVKFNSVHDASNAGVGTVFQEFSLVSTLRVYENIYLGNELGKGLFVSHPQMIQGTTKLFQDLGFHINVTSRVSKLSRAEQQMVEIAKAFHFKADILILDEPTASLTDKETSKLFSFIGRAKEQGVGIIYISHRIHEFEKIADRITILRDGKTIATLPGKGVSEEKLVELMTGREIGAIYPKINRMEQCPTLLSLRNIVSHGVKNVSLDVKAGEVLGIAGLVGSAKSRIWRSVVGLQPIHGGIVTLKGKDITKAKTKTIIENGLYYLPPDRKYEGLQLSATSRDNLSVDLANLKSSKGTMGFLSPSKIELAVNELSERVNLSQEYIEKTVSQLSGGNKQKVLFGKGLSTDRDVYIFDEPTVGVDMGTRAALYRLLKVIAESGKAVVVISSDLSEVMNISHRLLVFSNGEIAAELTGEEVSEEQVLKYFFAELNAVA